MRQQLTNGDALFSVLRELRPITRDRLLVVEPSTRVRHRQRHRREPLGRRMDDDHRAGLPQIAGLPVAYTAPEVDDRPARRDHAQRGSELAALGFERARLAAAGVAPAPGSPATPGGHEPGAGNDSAGRAE